MLQRPSQMTSRTSSVACGHATPLTKLHIRETIRGSMQPPGISCQARPPAFWMP